MKKQRRLVPLMTIALLMIFSGFLLGDNKCYAASSNISVNIDGEAVTFTQPPTIKDGSTLVPLRAIFEELGMTVEWDQTSKKIIASNSNVTINLQVGNTNASVGNNEAGFIETVLDAAPQNINGSVLVPVRFIGEASGSDVVWDGTTKSVNITSRPDRVFKGDEAFNSHDWGYEYMPDFNMIGYCIEGVAKEGKAKLDGFGRTIGWGKHIGMFKNGSANGYGIYTKENGDKAIGEFVDGSLPNGKYIFANGCTYVGPIDLSFLPNGIGTYTDTNGNTAKAKYINGEYRGIVDPTKSYDFYGNLLKEGDTVEFVTLSFNSFFGMVTAVDGGKVKVEWYDIQGLYGQSVLYSISGSEFAVLQNTYGITFYTPQWINADKLFLK